MKKYVLLFVTLLWLPLAVFAAKPINLILDWYPNPDHAALLYADAAGYFTQAGLQVKLISPTDPSIGLKMVAVGKADLAVTYQPSLVLAQREGLDVVWVATLVNQPLDSLVVLDQDTIRTLSDLKGKTIGYSTPGVDERMVYLMLQHVGLVPSDVTLVNIPNGLVASLMHGQISAMQGAMRNVEPFVFAAHHVKIKQFFPEDYGFPMYDELILVSSSKQANDPRYPLLVAALTKATQALKTDPDAAWQVVIHKYPTLNTPINQQSWQATIPLLDAHPGNYDAKRYQQFAAFIDDSR